jgi:hypothetical protein
MEELNKRLDKLDEKIEEYIKEYCREYITEIKSVIFSELIGHLLEKYKEKEMNGLSNYNLIFDVSGNAKQVEEPHPQVEEPSANVVLE